jgi:hypothetical protein
VMALRNEIEGNDSKGAFDKDVISLRGFLLNDTLHLHEIKVYDSAVIKGLSFQAVKKIRPFVNMFSEKLSRWCWCKDDRNKTFCLIEGFFRISLTSVFSNFPMAFVRPVAIGLSSRYPYNNVYDSDKLAIFT